MPGTFGPGRQFVADTQGAKETYSLGSYLRLGAVKGIVAEDVSYRCQLTVELWMLVSSVWVGAKVNTVQLERWSMFF